MTSTPTPEGQGQGGFRPKVAAAVALILAAGLSLLVFFGHRAVTRIYHLRQERARLEKENTHLVEENLRLARTVDRLHHDPEMIQDLIRRELNFVRKNEIIIQLPEGDKETSTGSALVPHRPPPERQRREKASRPSEPRPRSTGSRVKTP